MLFIVQEKISCLRQKMINSIPCLRQKSRKTYPGWPHVPIKPLRGSTPPGHDHYLVYCVSNMDAFSRSAGLKNVVYPVACHDNSRSCNRFLTTPILTVQVVRNLHFAICTCVRKATSHYPQRQEATICMRIARVTNLAHSPKAGKKCNHGNGCQQRSIFVRHNMAVRWRYDKSVFNSLRILSPPRKLLGNIHQPLIKTCKLQTSPTPNLKLAKSQLFPLIAWGMDF